MITASIVLFNTPVNQINTVLDSYAPSSNRKLYLIDNSNCFNEDYLFLSNIYGVEYVFNNKNVGYGQAHNIAIKKAIQEKSDYHIVLNPDLKFESWIVNRLEEYADAHLDVVYMLPKVKYPNGEIQYLCKLLPTPLDLFLRRFLPQNKSVIKRNDKYTLKNFGYNRIINPPCLSGCFMFMRTSVLEQYSLFFDNRFFMYFEDFDLIRRLHRIGKTIYYPDVEIIHNHMQMSYKNMGMLRMHIISACKYFNKYGWFFDGERKKVNKIILNEICNKENRGEEFCNEKNIGN